MLLIGMGIKMVELVSKNIKIDKGSNYQIINLSGQVVKTGVLDPNFSSNNLKYQTITCTELNNGFYFIKVIGEGGVLTLKFLKQ